MAVLRAGPQGPCPTVQPKMLTLVYAPLSRLSRYSFATADHPAPFSHKCLVRKDNRYLHERKGNRRPLGRPENRLDSHLELMFSNNECRGLRVIDKIPFILQQRSA